MLRIIQLGLGPGLIIWYDLRNGKGEINSVHGMLGDYIGQIPLQ
jgi:hypothetical protein